ncbi:MAG: ArsR family transcriptional regulator [Dehalococcoidia bacterium]
MTLHAPLHALPLGRQQIVRVLKLHDEASIDDLAREMSMSPSGVRQHLAPLEAEGFVAFRPLIGGQGRRKRLYYLTPAGHDLFPDRSGELAPRLVALLSAAAPDIVPGILRQVAEPRLKRFQQRFASESPADSGGRIKMLAGVFEEEQYIPVLEPRSAGVALRLNHCPYLRIARESTVICDLELRTVRELLPSMVVRRTACRGNGDRTCEYEMVEAPLPTASSAGTRARVSR